MRSSTCLRRSGSYPIGAALVVVGLLTAWRADAVAQTWGYYGGDRSFSRYSALDQIDARNVGELRVVWQRPGLDSSFREGFAELPVSAYLNSTPIFVDGILYAPNAIGLVEAFDPATGATIWLQQPQEWTPSQLTGQSTRGLDHWADGADRRLIAIRGEYLYALDPATGQGVAGFGEDGAVLLRPPGAELYRSSSGAIVVGDVIVVGGTVDGAGDSGDQWRGTPSEDIRGFDVRTGEQLWTFHVVPRDGEFGTETWAEGSWRESGDLGSWCCLSADEELGFVYVPLTAPTAAYYGGHRPGDNLYSNTLVALNARTGEQIWHFQMVRHDVWEYDNVGPPILGDITVGGETIPAVMQANKTAFLFVLNRVTGEPVWPIENRPVPRSNVPGERISPTQPFPTRPPPFDRIGITRDDLIDFTPELRERAAAIVDSFVIGPIFTPPSLVAGADGSGGGGTLMVPGSWGAANWNSGAFDPETGTYFAVSHTIPRVYRLARSTNPDSQMDYWSPGREAPYIDGLPLVKPPWGRVTAIDLTTGEHAWMVPNGEGPRDHPLLAGLDLPFLGIASRPAPLVTRTLLFLGEGSDLHGGIPEGMWGSTFRAYDKATGEILWAMELDAGTTGGPMTYEHEGRQYVIVAIGGREHPAEWVALGLP